MDHFALVVHEQIQCKWVGRGGGEAGAPSQASFHMCFARVRSEALLPYTRWGVLALTVSRPQAWAWISEGPLCG